MKEIIDRIGTLQRQKWESYKGEEGKFMGEILKLMEKNQKKKIKERRRTRDLVGIKQFTWNTWDIRGDYRSSETS